MGVDFRGMGASRLAYVGLYAEFRLEVVDADSSTARDVHRCPAYNDWPIRVACLRLSGAGYVPTSCSFCPYCGTRIEPVRTQSNINEPTLNSHYHPIRSPLTDERVIQGFARNSGFALLRDIEPYCDRCLDDLLVEHGNAFIASLRCAIMHVCYEVEQARRRHEFWQRRYSALWRTLERCLARVKHHRDNAERQALIELEQSDQPQSVVYLMTDGFALKIGTSNRKAQKRMMEHQVGNPRPLELLATLPGGKKREADIRKLFGEHRMRGEWFHDAPEIHAYFSEHGKL